LNPNCHLNEAAETFLVFFGVGDIPTDFGCDSGYVLSKAGDSENMDRHGIRDGERGVDSAPEINNMVTS